MRGAAWAVPVIAVAAVVPAASASPAACPAIPGGTSWTRTAPGPFGTNGLNRTYFINDDGTGTQRTNGTGYQVFADNGSTSVATTIQVTSSNITVPAKTTVNISFKVQFGYGFNGDQNQPNGSSNTTLQLSTIDPAGTNTFKTYSTKAGKPGEIVTPTNGPPFTAFERTATTSYVNSSSAPKMFQISYAFILSPVGTDSPAHTNNNDDYRVFPSFTSP